MLGQIANFCPGIARNSFLKDSTSLDDVWHKIRLHLGFQRTGAHFLDLSLIHLQPNERPETLFQRLNAFFQDNLLTSHNNITHHGVKIDEDEDMTPSLENTVVYMWLHLTHPGLPALVKQKYGAELRSKTLASLKPEISIALQSLMDELKSMEEVKAHRSVTNSAVFPPSAQHGTNPPRKSKSCVLCKAAGCKSFNTHWLRECIFLPDADRRAFARARLVGDEGCGEEALEELSLDSPHPAEDAKPID